MARELTREDSTPVLLYKGPATGYVENVKKVAMDKGYRLIDSRFLRKPFVKKMQELERISGKKLMFVEGKDVNLFTAKPKEKKNIPKTREERAIEANESVAKAVEMMTAFVGGKSTDDDLRKEIEELKALISKKESDEDKPKRGRPAKDEKPE
jgi:hypothetical protein